MFERYSEQARSVIFWARHIASQADASEIETEHILMGLLRTDKILARRFLGSPWAAEKVWLKIEQSKLVGRRPSGSREIPLSTESTRVLNLVAEEADHLGSKWISAEHVLLGLLRENKCFAARILHELGVRLESTRDELRRVPHNPSETEEFVRDGSQLTPEMVELKARLKSIKERLEGAIANHDFELARSYSDAEAVERERLISLYHQHGLLDWIFE